MGAGGFGQLVASPTDLIKTHMQMEGRRRLQGKKPRVNGMMDAARYILIRDKFIYNGFILSLPNTYMVGNFSKFFTFHDEGMRAT